MRKLIFIPLLFVCTGLFSQQLLPGIVDGARTVVAGPTTASDNFDAYTTNQELGDQTNWTAGLNSTNIKDIGGGDKGVEGESAAEILVFYSGETWGADHSSQVTLPTLGSQYIGASVRVTASGDGYTWYASSSESYLLRYVSGSLDATLDSETSGVIAATDDLRLEVTGTGATVTLKCYLNDVLYTGIDTDGIYEDTHANRLTTGSPGIGAFGNAVTTYADDWEGSDL